MAAYFNLTRKSNPEAGLVALKDLDIEICTLTGQPVDADRYCLNWYDSIGYWLAVGETWQQIRERHARWRDQDGPIEPSPLPDAEPSYYELLAKILDWLEENFTVDRWRR